MPRKFYRDKRGRFLSKTEYMRRRKISRSLRSRNRASKTLSRSTRVVAGRKFSVPRGSKFHQPEPDIIILKIPLTGLIDLVKHGSTKKSLERSVLRKNLKQMRGRNDADVKWVRVDFIEVITTAGERLHPGSFQIEIFKRSKLSIESMLIMIRKKISNALLNQSYSISQYYIDNLYEGKRGIKKLKSCRIKIWGIFEYVAK